MVLSPRDKVEKLRGFLEELELDLYVVPTTDAHDSEYPASADARRAYITNFTGSAGTAYIGKKEAWLATDGRYFLQASDQLDSDVWTLIKQGLLRSFQEGDIFKLPNIKRVGFDPYVTSAAWVEQIQQSYGDHVTLVPVDLSTLSKETSTERTQHNLVDQVWSEDGRPAYDLKPLTKLNGETQYSTSTKVKLENIRKQMVTTNVSLVIITALDEIAWLTNMRGADTASNRIFIAYMLVTPQEAILYLKDMEHRATTPFRDYLKEECCTIKDYDNFFQDLNEFIAKIPESTKIQVSPSVNFAIFSVLTNHAPPSAILNRGTKILTEPTPAAVAKSVKDQYELLAMMEGHMRDGAAVSIFLSWLEGLSPRELQNHTEVTVAEKLASMRKKQTGFVGNSFDTISAMGSNGAIIHYHPEPEKCKRLFRGMYLVDSGGHYNGSTTDVTRTVHLGQPSEWERECYTRVLKGHINLAQAIFPEGTRGYQLNVLAQSALWEVGLDFMHGTGHGVGASICVHEFPPNIGSRAPQAHEKLHILKPGMFVSDEPGYYEDGHFGIRIENVMFVKSLHTPHNFNGLNFFGFEMVTLVPYCRKLINVNMLSAKEVDWLNEYHREVERKLSPIIEMESGLDESEIEAVLNWLADATSEL